MVNLETEWRASSLPDTHQSLTVTLPPALIFSSHSLLTDQLFVDKTNKQRNTRLSFRQLLHPLMFPWLGQRRIYSFKKDGVAPPLAPYPLAFPLPCSLVGCPHKSNSNTAQIQQSIPRQRPVFHWESFFWGERCHIQFLPAGWDD